MIRKDNSLLCILMSVLFIITISQISLSQNLNQLHKTQNNKGQLTIPGWQKLEDFRFSGLAIEKTSSKDFNKTYPFINNYEDTEDDIRIYTYKPEKESNFFSVKFGFEDSQLSWIDFVPKSDITLEEVIENYGTPLAINTKVSKYLDYYDYGNFVISLTKDRGNVYTITQYDNKNESNNNAKNLKLKLPPWEELIQGKVDKLIPGQTNEAELTKIYSGIKKLSNSNQGNTKVPFLDVDNFEGTANSTYCIDKGLGDTDYKRVELIFSNNVLNWVDLIPKKLTLEEALKTYTEKYKLDDSNQNVDFYNFKNLILAVSKKNGIVLNIGVLGSVNSKLRDVLLSWEELNSKDIKSIKIDTTTENQLFKAYPGLIAQKQAEANVDILKVSEGISSMGYQVIFFVFQNKKLTSVDFIPLNEIQVSDVIEAYGKKYELDNKSDKTLDFYTFNNVIVSVFKDSKIVNSIGLF